MASPCDYHANTSTLAISSRGVATVVSMLPRTPLACRNVGGATQ